MTKFIKPRSPFIPKFNVGQTVRIKETGKVADIAHIQWDSTGLWYSLENDISIYTDRELELLVK